MIKRLTLSAAILMAITASSVQAAPDSCPSEGYACKKTYSEETIRARENYNEERKAGHADPIVVKHYPNPEVKVVTETVEVVKTVTTKRRLRFSPFGVLSYRHGYTESDGSTTDSTDPTGDVANNGYFTNGHHKGKSVHRSNYDRDILVEVGIEMVYDRVGLTLSHDSEIVTYLGPMLATDYGTFSIGAAFNMDHDLHKDIDGYRFTSELKANQENHVSMPNTCSSDGHTGLFIGYHTPRKGLQLNAKLSAFETDTICTSRFSSGADVTRVSKYTDLTTVMSVGIRFGF